MKDLKLTEYPLADTLLGERGPDGQPIGLIGTYAGGLTPDQIDAALRKNAQMWEAIWSLTPGARDKYLAEVEQARARLRIVEPVDRCQT